MSHHLSTVNATTLAAGCHAACPGCRHRALSAADSQIQKHAWLSQRLQPWLAQLQKLCTCTKRWAYRSRVALHTRWDEQHGWRFGLWKRDQLIPIEHCPVHHPMVNASLALLREVLPPAAHFPLAYYVQAGAQITLVVKTAQAEWPLLTDDFYRKLAELGIDGLWLNCHPAAGVRLFAKRGWRLLWGQAYSHDTLGRYGPAAFQQPQAELYQQSLALAEQFLQLSADTPVIDLYCGRGVSLARWCARSAPCLGVEISTEAVHNARFNAQGAELLQGPCAQRLPQIRAWQATHPGALRVYVNPPRTGLEPPVLEWLANSGVERLAYLSCNANSLARDLSQLEQAGLRVACLQPYDFFPQTDHVETLALLRRQPSAYG